MSLAKWLRQQWDRTLAVSLVFGGMIALGLGWHGVANAVLPAGQIPYVVSGGLGGLFALGLGATLWLSAELRDQWHKLDRLEKELGALRPAEEPQVELPAAPTTARCDGTARRPDVTAGQNDR